jgi:hypothetical protein
MKIKGDDMINRFILLPIASLAFLTFLYGCGEKGSNPLTEPNLAETWYGTWVSSKVVSSGTLSMTITRPDTTYSGRMIMTGSPCFSTASITEWIVNGNTVNWISPEIGNFTGTIIGASITGTYAVTATGACSGDTGIFSLTDL